MTLTLRAFLAVAIGILSAGFAQAAPVDNKPKVQARLIAGRDAIAPGGQVSVALHEVIRKNWHTYWRNPGDAGEPTSITWRLPPGWRASPIQWPAPTRLPVGPLMDFGYSDEVALLVDIEAPPEAKVGTTARLTADAKWLVCEEVCIPEEATLTLDLAIAAKPPPVAADKAAFFARARAQLPPQAAWPAHYAASDSEFTLQVEAPALAAARPRDAFFFPYTDGYVANAAPQRFAFSQSGMTLTTKPGWRLATAAKRAAAGPLGGVLTLTNAQGTSEAFALTATPGAGVAVPVIAGIGFLEALLFAFLGGLILNLMPCVLPVLSIKALALARVRGATHTHEEALAYGVGVVASFAALGGLLVLLRAGGAAVGWGFQLQEPIVVAAFALLMFAVGLNLSGLFELGAGIARMGDRLTRHGGIVGSLLTGVLAVAVAAPCTAPFMGAAMGFALTQPAAIAMGVFLALSLGFAAPFVLLGFWPRALRLLPKPGPWMLRLRQVLAIPMYATALWLLWVLSLEAGAVGVVVLLAAALALSVALWAYGETQHVHGRARALRRIAMGAGLVATLALLPLAGTGKPESAQLSVLPSQPYSAALLARLRAEGRPVFINATAAWCITCLVNEQVALSREGMADIFARNGVAYLVADWTNRDREVTALLAAHERSGVPLYLYFPPHAGEAVVLPQILTENAVRSAVETKHSAMSQ